MSALGGRSGPGGGHHCVKGCTSSSTQVCIRKGHKAFCKLCTNMGKPMYGCNECKIRSDSIWSKKPVNVQPTRAELAAAERQQKREAKEALLKKGAARRREVEPSTQLSGRFVPET